MTGRTHLIVGILAGIAVAHLNHLHSTALILPALAGGIGGLLPDLDHPQSMLSGFVPGAWLLQGLISHRGPTHALLFIPAVAALLVAVGAPSVITLALMAGMISHLICDMSTPAGVRLFQPVAYGSWRLLPGGILGLPGVAWAIETLVGAGAMIGIVLLIVEGIR